MTLQLSELGLMSPEEKRNLLALLIEDALLTPPATPEPTRPRSQPKRQESTPGLRFELLGPLAVRYGNVEFAPSAPKLRAMIATLLFNANRSVAASALVRELWENEPPRTSHATVQTYVFKLRKLFRDVLGVTTEYVNNELLLTHSGGYTLLVADGQLDIEEFERLVIAGSAELRAGEYDKAAHNLRRSLALWRGPVSPELQWGMQLRAHSARLEERRFYAQMMRIEADLCLGLHREMISELASVVVEHPLHEPAHAMFMAALYRSGRTSAALDVFRRFRRQMLQELGMEPSARIQSLHLALLRNDVLLDNRGLTSEMLLDRLGTAVHGRAA
ncbi:MAG TPA: AfsR/SARP family transcriptional regulator [Actinophytocola sp.]|uniref:AfsR/SARP family transcriptional regulator n=1 Tax=Actinophytocola sp. TaxID=1872138 RepID=UPI002DBDC2AD|nr:AfsR/SARP family transcriptional regulator [Actinophytocola sp.]HEU5470912.1 AfsR/SARP family transcriptional regulator [Actinophytocola sp.]